MYSFLFVLTTKAERVPVLYIQFFFQLLGPLPRQSRVTSVNQSCLHSQRASEVFFFFCQCLVSTWALPHVRFWPRNLKIHNFWADWQIWEIILRALMNLVLIFFFMFEKRLMYVKNQKQHIFSVDFLILKGGLWQRLNKSFRVSKQKNRWRYLKP